MKLKKLLSVLIVICMCASMFTTVASAKSIAGEEAVKELVEAPDPPTATVTELTDDAIPTNVPLYEVGASGLQPTYEKVSKLGAAYRFVANEVTDEVMDYYGDWHCDYIVTFDQDSEAGTFGLYGAYGSYGEIAFVYPEAIAAGESIKLVESALKVPLTYRDVKENVGTFTCGAFNLDGNNANKKMTVKLAIWNEDPLDGRLLNSREYDFKDIAEIIPPNVPTATVEASTVPQEDVQLYEFDDQRELQPIDWKVKKLGVEYTFTADDVSEETYQYYKDWRCDYIVTFNSDIDAGTFGLYGKYGNYDMAFVFPENITAGTSIKLVEGLGLGPQTYAIIKNTVQSFTCGAFNLDASNAGKEMKVELAIWKDGEEDTLRTINSKTYDFGDLTERVPMDTPKAIITKQETPETNVPVYVQTEITDPRSITKIASVATIDSVYTFGIDPNESEATSEYYKDWLCDYKVTFNQDIPANTFGLYGSYGEYNIAFVYPYDIHANDSLYLLDMLQLGKWTYQNIKRDVTEFKCGAFNLSEGNMNVGKEMDVSLVMWAPGTQVTDGCIVAAEETYDFGDLTELKVTISATAKDTGGNSVSATITGGGDYKIGESVTLSANNAAGYEFVGWYLGEELKSENPVYTFDAMVDGEYTAVYKATGGANLTVTADRFTVSFNGGEEISGTGSENYNEAVGTQVTLNYSGDDFLYWVNSSNNIVSREEEYSFVLVGTTDLRAISTGEFEQEARSAYLVFHNAYDQIMKEMRCTEDTIQFPDVNPGKMSSTFDKWVFEDDGKEATEAAIAEKMSASENVILNIVPEYTPVSGSYTVKVNVKADSTVTEVQSMETAIGEPTVISKEQVAEWCADKELNYTADDFGFFSLDGGDSAITYGDQYTALSGVANLEIVVTVVVTTATPEPVLAITQMIAAENGSGKYKVSTTMKYYVPDGYSVRESGFVYSRYTGDPAELKLENVGDQVKKYLTGGTEASATATMNINTSYADRIFNVVAFLTYEDDNNNIVTIYSDVRSGSYDTLS